LLSHPADCCGEFHYADDGDGGGGGDDDDDGVYGNQSPMVTLTDHGDAFYVLYHHHHSQIANDVAFSTKQ